VRGAPRGHTRAERRTRASLSDEEHFEPLEHGVLRRPAGACAMIRGGDSRPKNGISSTPGHAAAGRLLLWRV
jgi:hypothetical protein